MRLFQELSRILGVSFEAAVECERLSREAREPMELLAEHLLNSGVKGYNIVTQYGTWTWEENPKSEIDK